MSILLLNQLGFLINKSVHGGVVNHITEPTMNTKPTALDAYLARTAAIRAKLDEGKVAHQRVGRSRKHG